MLRYVSRAQAQTEFPRPEGMPDIVHRLLCARGIATAEAAEAFLHPSKDRLLRPELLPDLSVAAQILRDAIAAGKRICVYGDYDVDGVCASAILRSCLVRLGADVRVYIPSRHNEGYGLNEAAVRDIAGDCNLLITVDCGISSHDLIELAKSLGLTCIVTDHHRVGDVLPECPTVNPRMGGYPFPYLCGAGVAWKLAWALTDSDTAMEWIDLAATATVADVVSLTEENRAIVYLGLQKINKSPCPGLRALLDSAHIPMGEVTSQIIAFRVAPRLNAGGRLGDAHRSYELLTATDPFEAVIMADELEQENARRQNVEKEIRATALRQLADFDFSAHRVVLVHGEGWNSGVIGLAASHLREQFYYPVIAMSENDGVLTGSCRSIPGVDIFEVLTAASDLLVRYGGHSQAAGLTVRIENLPALQERLDAYIREHVPDDVYVPVREYDMEVTLEELPETAVLALSALEPTGSGNPEPVFRAECRRVEARTMGAQNAHLRLLVSDEGTRRSAVFFGAGERANEIAENIDILFTPQINEWNGRRDVQLRLYELKNCDNCAQIDATKPMEDVYQRRFLTLLSYNKKINHELAPAITGRQLARMSDKCAQGILVVAGDIESARLALGTLGWDADLYIGKMCPDARMYNSVCFCPDSLAFPPALRTLVLAGVPEAECFFGLPNVQVLTLVTGRTAFSDIPDVDGMRNVYKAALYLSRREERPKDREALDIRIAGMCRMKPFACRAALLALEDMGLAEITDEPFTLRVPPAKKTDPESSDVWRALQEMKRS